MPALHGSVSQGCFQGLAAEKDVSYGTHSPPCHLSFGLREDGLQERSNSASQPAQDVSQTVSLLVASTSVMTQPGPTLTSIVPAVGWVETFAPG